MTLTEFLLARIAEDEDDARAAVDDDPNWLYPARGLAECEAKRRIVALHEATTDFSGEVYCWVCSNVERTGLDTYLEPMPCPTLRLLALPYADHPDYQPAWKP
jgi:hypothetical protein